MNNVEINLAEKCPKKLGMAPTAKKLFHEINQHSNVILNFENIEFMSRSFAQEYVFQKHNSKTDIIELNMSPSIERLIEIVDEDFKNSCLK